MSSHLDLNQWIVELRACCSFLYINALAVTTAHGIA